MTPSRKRRWQLSVLLLLLLLLGLGWSFWPDRKLSAARTLQQELFSPAAGSLTAEQRQEKWRALRDVQKNLSPTQRRELSSEMRKRRQKEMAKYFKMSAAEKTRFLDEQIKRMQQGRPQGPGGPAGAPGRGPGGPGAPGRAPGARPGGTAGAAGTVASAGPTPANRDERRRERLDSSTPAERAMMSQFFHDLNARRAQLGLATGRGPGR